MSREQVNGWNDAIGQAAIVLELETIFERTQAAIEERGPACWASGRCCNFEKTGHRLYVTGLETAYAVAKGATATSETVVEARARGGCPFQESNLCGIHAIKPLGCRVYFCDKSSEEWQRELYERMLTEIRGIHDRWQIEYRYGEWRDMLELFAGAGRST